MIKTGANKLALYGSYDQHIKMIEDAFSVGINARGEEICIVGDRDQVGQAEVVFSQLMLLSGEDHHLTVEDVDHAIQHVLSEGDGEEKKTLSLHESHQERVTVSSKKKSIKPKSVAQKCYIKEIRNHNVVIGIGPAGTGKTYLAMAMAVSAFLKKEVERIILVRPAVEAGESLGFLPGTLVEKVNPYLRPLYDALYDMMEVDQANRHLERGDIEIASLAFMRGRTLNDAYIILDEAQNTTSAQMKMFLTRLGYRSKAVITGDITQVDLPPERVSGLVEIQDILKAIDEIRFVYFTEKDVVRHHLVQAIIKAYQSYNETEGEDKAR